MVKVWTSTGDENDRFNAQELDDDGSCGGSGIKKDLVDQVLTRLRAESCPASPSSSKGAVSEVGVEGGVRGEASTSNCREM